VYVDGLMASSSEEVDWAFEDSKRYPYQNDFHVGRDLGEGKFSVVKYAEHKKTGQPFAIKCIDRVNTNPDELVHEAMLIQMVEDHPGIIKIKDVYEDTKFFYLVMEYVAGGELFDRIVQQDSYSEKEAATVIRQITSIVQFVHSKNVVHRDLKPENLLYADKAGTELKLCDFGLADTIDDNELLTAIVGSTTYMAPEVAKGIGYDKSVDLYSIGVILYILLCGYPPFEPEAGIVDLEFPAKEWGEITKSVKELITNLLSADPTRRPTATQLLQHTWIKGEAVSTRKLTGTIKTIKKYQVAHKTGQTMRTKDPLTKATVFNMFDDPSSSPASPHSPSSETKELEDKKPKDEKKPKDDKKKSEDDKKKSDDDKKKSEDDKKKRDKDDKKAQDKKEKEKREDNQKRDDKKDKDKKKGKKEDTKKKEPENGTTRKPDPKALASSPRAVSFVDSNPKADTHRSDPSKDQELIKSLQKELDEERKKVKSLEARIADLEKKSSKGASSNNKKGSKPSKK